jgi:thiamine biosynthesis lipoprotein
MLGVKLSLLFSLLLFTASCTNLKFWKEEQLLLGTKCSISAYGEDPRDAVEAAFAEIERMDKLFSDFREDSILSRLNREGHLKETEETREVIWLIKRAVFFAEKSEGAFDPTVGPLMKLWGFRGGVRTLPSSLEIQKTLFYISYKNIIVEKDGIRLTKGEIDLGGIAKGYAVDRATYILKNKGIKKALVNAGGNIYGFGKAWKIGIQDPRDKTNLIGYLKIQDAGVASSGDYERFFIIDGKRYSHIMDPRTGYPKQGVIATTVKAKDATTADALSTTLFVMGKDGLKLCKELSAEAALWDEEKRLWKTPSFTIY